MTKISKSRTMSKRLFNIAAPWLMAVLFGSMAFVGIASAKFKPKTQSVRVSLTESGYSPTQLRLRKGVPARITFVRKTEDGCGREVVIPAYNIRRELPLNMPVSVRFTPNRAGTFGFACGMKMLKGTLIVR